MVGDVKQTFVDSKVKPNDYKDRNKYVYNKTMITMALPRV